MMKPSPSRPARRGLFRPRQFAIPPSLVLVPYFAEAALYAQLQQQAVLRRSFLHSSLLHFDRFAIVSGFLGYPHLFTLLELVADLPEKEVYFLGSAGALAPRLARPQAVQVGEVAPGAIFKRFGGGRALALKAFPDHSLPVVRGVSVDVIQRETPAWLAEQRRQRADIVEMELFPLRWFLGRPFHALVVLSDRVRPGGIRPFADRETFGSEFSRAFHAIRRHIDHG